MRGELGLHSKGKAGHGKVAEEETTGIGGRDAALHAAQRAEIPGEINRLVSREPAALHTGRSAKGQLLELPLREDGNAGFGKGKQHLLAKGEAVHMDKVADAWCVGFWSRQEGREEAALVSRYRDDAIG